jgi:hypothetical protein
MRVCQGRVSKKEGAFLKLRRPDETFFEKQSGGGGIRTHERLATPTVFETAPFNHSGTPPGSASEILARLNP